MSGVERRVLVISVFGFALGLIVFVWAHAKEGAKGVLIAGEFPPESFARNVAQLSHPRSDVIKANAMHRRRSGRVRNNAGSAATGIPQASGRMDLSWNRSDERIRSKRYAVTSSDTSLVGVAQHLNAEGYLSDSGAMTKASDETVVLFREQPYAELPREAVARAFRDDENLNLRNKPSNWAVPTDDVSHAVPPLALRIDTRTLEARGESDARAFE